MAAVVAVAMVVATVVAVAPAPTAAAADRPDDLDAAMYFHAQVRDAPECAMTVEDGRIVVDPALSNPAMTCPDMFAWKLFAEAVTDEFWKGWAADRQTWPAEPLPLCRAGTSGPDCCTPGGQDNPGYDNADNPAVNCPYFPGDHLAGSGSDTPPPLREANPLSKAHAVNFSGMALGVTAQEIDALDPGRVIRQSMAELVFRNKPMFDYVFRNNLYNTQGLADVFRLNGRFLARDVPYRPARSEGAAATIDFPVASIMIKSNWIQRDRAEEIGIVEDPENPFVKMRLESAVTDNNGRIFEPGEHWLVAFHLSSKDTPNWVWATFEHANNPGRCDYVGCNDSYGYASPDEVPAGAADNFTAPHTISDGLPIPQRIFDPGKVYADGPIRAGLDGVLSGMGVAAGPAESVDPATPSAGDPAWRSYRLKGAQVDFVDAMGNPDFLGNSVTEGGFVPSSSCITCHARAHVGPDGTPGVLGVFVDRVDTIGYPESANGIPNPAWYLSSNQPTIGLEALQTDFVWGFFFANELR